MVGCGRWGHSYLNTVKKMDSVSIDWIVLRKSVPELIDGYKFTYNLDKLLQQEKVDGVIIVTPPNTHFEIAKICIKNNVPVLIEKPFTNSYKKSLLLKKQIDKKGLICLVGYQHLYSQKYKLLKLQKNRIGQLKNIYSLSISDGPFRNNVSVIRDWGSHEVAVAIDLFEETPKSIKINKINENFINPYKGLYNLQMEFSSQKKFNSIFGNQSKVKRKDLFVEFSNGFVFQNNLSQGSNITVSNGEFSNLNQISEIVPLPLESVVKEFMTNIKNNFLSPMLNLSVNVNKILDQLEIKMME